MTTLRLLSHPYTFLQPASTYLARLATYDCTPKRQSTCRSSCSAPPPGMTLPHTAHGDRQQ
eukprot:23922-Eustigmatos_ZCMA.PRE.1